MKTVALHTAEAKTKNKRQANTAVVKMQLVWRTFYQYLESPQDGDILHKINAWSKVSHDGL